MISTTNNYSDLYYFYDADFSLRYSQDYDVVNAKKYHMSPKEQFLNDPNLGMGCTNQASNIW